MTISAQFLAVVVMTLGGLQAALAYDTYAILFRPRQFWNQIAIDLLFFLTQACILFYFLYTVNGGVLKFYLAIAVLLGVSVYYALFQTYYRRFLMWLIRLVQVIFQNLISLFIILIVKLIICLFKIILSCLIIIFIPIQKIFILLGKIIRTLLKPLMPREIQEISPSF